MSVSSKLRVLDIVKEYTSAENFDELTNYNVAVLNFSEYYCKPCIEEVPLLNKIKEEISSDKVGYFTISSDNFQKMESLINKHGFNFTHIASSSDSLRMKVCELYRKQENSKVYRCALPSTAVVDIENNEIITLVTKQIKNKDEVINEIFNTLNK